MIDSVSRLSVGSYAYQPHLLREIIAPYIYIYIYMYVYIYTHIYIYIYIYSLLTKLTGPSSVNDRQGLEHQHSPWRCLHCSWRVSWDLASMLIPGSQKYVDLGFRV